MPRLKWRLSTIIGPKTFFACLLVSLIWALLPSDPHKWATSTSVQAANSAGAATGAARQPHSPPKPGDLRQLTIKELGNFEYDPEDKSAAIPADVRALEGMNVRLQGFMIPTDQAEGVSHFVLVPSLFSCCYGQPPGVQHVIEVTCAKGMTVPFEVVEIYAQGTLHVKEKRDGGYVVSLFSLDCTSMKRV
ncbi:MAG TPA: DUF3299 domain-containing protein [Humisphaera sp.]|jgi:hypothetical protein|nr:DUF3299 domain-containing protein [Humisphaera sp.]